jgi:hypothetical protein
MEILEMQTKNPRRSLDWGECQADAFLKGNDLRRGTGRLRGVAFRFLA